MLEVVFLVADFTQVHLFMHAVEVCVLDQVRVVGLVVDAELSILSLVLKRNLLLLLDDI